MDMDVMASDAVTADAFLHCIVESFTFYMLSFSVTDSSLNQYAFDGIGPDQWNHRRKTKRRQNRTTFEVKY